MFRNIFKKYVIKREMLHNHCNISTGFLLKLAYEDNYYLNTSKELANIYFYEMAGTRNKHRNCQKIFLPLKLK